MEDPHVAALLEDIKQKFEVIAEGQETIVKRLDALDIKVDRLDVRADRLDMRMQRVEHHLGLNGVSKPGKASPAKRPSTKRKPSK